MGKGMALSMAWWSRIAMIGMWSGIRKDGKLASFWGSECSHDMRCGNRRQCLAMLCILHNTVFYFVMSTIRLLFLVLQLWFYPRRLRAEGSLTLDGPWPWCRNSSKHLGLDYLGFCPNIPPKKVPCTRLLKNNLGWLEKMTLYSHMPSQQRKKNRPFKCICFRLPTWHVFSESWLSPTCTGCHAPVQKRTKEFLFGYGPTRTAA